MLLFHYLKIKKHPYFEGCFFYNIMFSVYSDPHPGFWPRFGFCEMALKGSGHK
jgi:hypothetical protein